jgi:hypothetical protein
MSPGRRLLPVILTSVVVALVPATGAAASAPFRAITQDRDLDGRLDAVQLTSARPTRVVRGSRGWPIAVPGRRVTKVSSRGRVLRIRLHPGKAPDTGARPAIRVLRRTPGRGSVSWQRAHASLAHTLKPKDGAVPVPVAASRNNAGLVITMSESVPRKLAPRFRGTLVVRDAQGHVLRLGSLTARAKRLTVGVQSGLPASVAVRVGRRTSRPIALREPGAAPDGPSGASPAPPQSNAPAATSPVDGSGAEPPIVGPRDTSPDGLAGDRTPLASVDEPIAPKYQLDAPWGTYSHWMQPWRGYLDTQPASAMRDAVGINFNVNDKEVGATARLLAASGVRRARIELSWGAMDPTDPNRLLPNEATKLRNRLEAFKANGIRPLLLLNSNHGQPTPLTRISLQVTEAAPAGATTVKLSPASAATVVPNHTGFDGRTQYKAAQILIVSVDDTGTATLAKPLPWALAPGAYGGSTLEYLPFAAPYLTGGTSADPNPDYQETLTGWLRYAGAIANTAETVLGSQSFDVEVWNEMTFGADFLYRDKYFSATTGWGNITDQLPRDTVRWFRSNGFDRVGVTNGFESQRPWASGATMPPGLTAISKHPYAGIRRFPADARSDGNRPIDALGANAGTRPQIGLWIPSFTPAYVSLFPEYFLAQIQTETLIRDMSPYTTTVSSAKTPHGRYTHPEGSPPPEIWLTEINLDSSGADLTTPQGETVAGQGFSAADVRHFETKAVLRYLSSYVNKGAGAIYFYAAKAGNLSLVDPSFFSAIAAGQDPGTALGGDTMDALRRYIAHFQGPDTLTKPRALTVDRIGDFDGAVQFDGIDTPGMPDLANRDVLAVLPFQVTDRRFVIPTYVMTRNMTTVYRPDAPASDPTRMDLPPELFRIAVGNLGSCDIDVSASDPLGGDQVPVDVVSCKNGRAEIDMPVTDVPRQLVIELR